MYIDPNRYTTRPTDDRIPQELAIYDRLEELSIPYVRVDHDRADTIEICHEVERVLGSRICKNGDKPFKTKFLSAQLGCSRLSFADDGHMRDYLQTLPGSVSALELLFDTDRRVKLVIDRDLLADAYISGHPGISTSTLQLKREDLLKFAESTGHPPVYVDLPDPRKEEV